MSTIPNFNPADPVQYIVDLDNLQKNIIDPKKKQILKYINSWMGKKNDDEKIKSFNGFRNMYLGQFPNDVETKKFLCKYFEVYNQDFNLNLEYNEKLFTRYNGLYLLKLMLNTIHYDLKKEKIKNYKRYTIVYKK
jgi:hypothetical protein